MMRQATLPSLLRTVLPPQTILNIPARSRPTPKSMANAALAGDYVWTFRTGLLENADSTDSSPPLLLSTDPADSDIDVPVNQIISASFNERWILQRFAAPSNLTVACPVASFTVTCTAPVSCPTPAGTVSYSGTTATFTPSSSLQADATYSVVIAASDLAGNAIGAGGSTAPNHGALQQVLLPQCILVRRQ